MKKIRKNHKILSWLLILAMVFGSISLPVKAAEPTVPESGVAASVEPEGLDDSLLGGTGGTAGNGGGGSDTAGTAGTSGSEVQTPEAELPEQDASYTGTRDIEDPTMEMAETNQDDKIGTEYWGVQTEAKVYDDFENDIWLQYQQKEMQVGDTVSLRPWRLEQIVSNTITNDVARPNFHFEIIAGDSVELNTDISSDKAIVTTKKTGTSVVKVTYDAMDYNGKHWGAISDVNTAYAVYTVGEEGKAAISCAELDNWRHYDTIYYNEGSTTPFKFTVNAENAASVQVTLNGKEITGQNHTYTANLENRSNIIGIRATDEDGKVRSYYRVVDARFVKVNVENKSNPGRTLRAGDTATISLTGITMPVYKLATIYNPCMNGWGAQSTHITYQNQELGEFKGSCSQWDLATNNDFDVKFDKTGLYRFTSEDGIYCEWFGSPLGSDITAQGSGEPNLNAPIMKGYFSTLPDFTVKVTEDGAEAVEQQIDALGTITSLDQKPDVEAARKAYDALTDDQKSLVTNIDILKDAEKEIERLEALSEIPEEGGSVTIDIERFTIGQGFYLEPVKVPFEAGDTVKDILKRLESANLLFNSSETYLSGIRGADDKKQGIHVPEYISEKLGGPTTEEAIEKGNSDDILGEFDYSQASGWYYFVNNTAPDKGMADYYAKPDDVIRLQFTLLWGMDLTGKNFGEEVLVTISDKDEALRLLAEINARDDKAELLKDTTIKAAYDTVVKSVQNAVESQENVDVAVTALEEALRKGPAKPENPEPGNPDSENPDEEIDTVTLLNKKYGIALTGEGLTEDMELVITPLGKEDKDVILMRDEIPSSKALFRLFHIKLMKDGEEIDLPDTASLTIPVGDKYEGQEMELLFCKDGKVTALKGKVTNGSLKTEIEELGSFGVVVDVAGDGTGTAGFGSGAGGGSAAGGSGGFGNAKTGDAAPIGLFLLMMAAAIAMMTYKKREMN